MCQRNGFGGYKSFRFCLTYILYGLWGIIRVYNNNKKCLFVCLCGEICELAFSLKAQLFSCWKLKIGKRLGTSVSSKQAVYTVWLNFFPFQLSFSYFQTQRRRKLYRAFHMTPLSGVVEISFIRSSRASCKRHKINRSWLVILTQCHICHG